jgi:hypothetical protein
MSPRGKQRLPRKEWIRARSAISLCATASTSARSRVARPVHVIDDPLDAGNPDQSPTPRGAAFRRRQCGLVGTRPAAAISPRSCRMPPGSTRGRTVGTLDGQQQTAFDQKPRQLVTVLGGLQSSGREIGARRFRILRSVEMLGLSTGSQPANRAAARRCSSRRWLFSSVS